MIDFLNARKIVTDRGEIAEIARGAEILFRKQRYKCEVGWLESTGTQHIDLGGAPSSGTALEMVVSGISANSFSSSSGTWFAGARNAYLSRAFGFYYNPTDKKMYYAFGDNMLSASYTSLYGTVKKIYADGSGLYIDDAKVVSTVASDFTAPASLVLFGLNNNGSVISRTSYRLHSGKRWENGVLVRDLIPVLDWNDRPCMYDKVTEELLYNQGTGEFLYGEL